MASIFEASAGLGLPGVVSQGDEWPVHHDTLVQANAGYDAYDNQYNPASYPMAPFGASPDGIGAYAQMISQAQPGAIDSGVLGALGALGSFFGSSPLVRGMKMLRPTRRSVRGYGAADDPVTAPASASAVPAPPIQLREASVLAVSVGLLVTGIAGYYVGKAVAPSRDKETKYAWWGVVAGLLGGPVGLGIEAAVALNQKGG